MKILNLKTIMLKTIMVLALLVGIGHGEKSEAGPCSRDPKFCDRE